MQEKDYKPYFHAPANNKNKPAHTIRQQNVYCIAVLVILCMFISVTTALNANDIARKNEKFVYEFNLAAGPVLYQESVDDIKSIAPGYKLDAKEWATVWRFADKYNITEFPKYTGDIYNQRAASQEFIEQITNADAYVESTNMSTETASNFQDIKSMDQESMTAWLLSEPLESLTH